MQKITPRQVVQLKQWKARKPKPTAPQFSGRLTFTPHLLEYLALCISSEEAPEFFVSVWINDEDGVASLGLAVPTEYVAPKNRLSLDDFEEEDGKWSR